MRLARIASGVKAFEPPFTPHTVPRYAALALRSDGGPAVRDTH